MKISIITVVYNGIRHIADAIDSVLEQDYPNIEYIVIDGASTDGTRELIASYGKRIHKFVSEPDKGIYDAMNKGLKLATGDIVGILNSDDFYVNGQVISKIAEAFKKENCDTVYGDLVYIDAQDEYKVVRYWQAGEYRNNSFLKGWMPPHPTFFVKRHIYEEYGRFNTSMCSAADYELMLRFLHRYQVSTTYIPEVLVKMRVGGLSNSSLRHRWRANMEDRMAWELNNLKPHFYTLYIKPIYKIKQYFTRPQVLT